MKHTCRIGSVEIGAGSLAVIAGPCVAESLELCLTVAEHMVGVCEKLGLAYVFKASFDKANRSSGDSYRGPGLAAGLEMLRAVGDLLDVPLLCDIHEPAQAAPAAEVVHCLQIPAFLCRQTDLLIAAARTGKAINIKKGQFMAPWDMRLAVEKAEAVGNDQVILTERGTSFGYNNLVSDLRAIPLMQQLGCPVLFDATHSVMLPGGAGDRSGGDRTLAPVLARAAVAAGCDGVFLEVHPEPEKGLSDSATMLPLAEARPLLESLLRIREALAPGG
ncbi:MAG: 3-deoxy-8-phosphooctulonate synthase [Planctomycetes bacterium]|nr:3-deoxy-8-phosphooctulonate synthase [Planctomycetota bacterium]